MTGPEWQRLLTPAHREKNGRQVGTGWDYILWAAYGLAFGWVLYQVVVIILWGG